MRRALLSMPVAVAILLVGCEAILGIPSDMERDGDAGPTVDATDDAEPTPKADAIDYSTVSPRIFSPRPSRSSLFFPRATAPRRHRPAKSLGKCSNEMRA